MPGKLGKLKNTPLYSAIKMHYLMPAKNIKIAKLCYITRLSRTPKYKAVTIFLFKLGMKPHASSGKFSVNNVAVRPTHF